MHNMIIPIIPYLGYYGVMVSTLDFESSDPSSNLGRTLFSLSTFGERTSSSRRYMTDSFIP